MTKLYWDFITLQRKVEALLREDDIEIALLAIFDFLEVNQTYIQSRIPQSKAIVISASVARLKRAFHYGLIEWGLTNQVRSDLVEECLNLLEYLRRDVEESGYERRNYPHIGSFPHLFIVESALERIENILIPFMKKG